MQLTENERAALVDELEEELRNAYTLGLDSKRYSPLLAVQPFVKEIDRLLAATDAPGLDELLDSVHPESAVTAWLESRPEPESGIMAPHFMAKIETHGKNVFWGDGTTRMDAIRNAVAQATAT